MRLDRYLVAQGRFDSRAQAQAAIAAGKVRVNGRVVEKSSLNVTDGDAVEAQGAAYPWVSRGGVKLAAALDVFKIDPNGLVGLDLGASTGGFTDVLLSRGAAKVYAVDVGHGQLHDKLRSDPRVIVLEKTHAKDLTSALVPDATDLIVCDVSFISLRKALPPALALAAPRALLVALVKPQFEVGPDKIGKGGVVRDAAARAAALDEVVDWMSEPPGWRVAATAPSPIEGGDGNVEYLLCATRETSE